MEPCFAMLVVEDFEWLVPALGAKDIISSLDDILKSHFGYFGECPQIND